MPSTLALALALPFLVSAVLAAQAAARWALYAFDAHRRRVWLAEDRAVDMICIGILAVAAFAFAEIAILALQAGL